jgi:hypothetical protein
MQVLLQAQQSYAYSPAFLLTHAAPSDPCCCHMPYQKRFSTTARYGNSQATCKVCAYLPPGPCSLPEAHAAAISIVCFLQLLQQRLTADAGPLLLSGLLNLLLLLLLCCACVCCCCC